MNSKYIHSDNKVLGPTHDDAVPVGNPLTNRTDAENPPSGRTSLLVGGGASSIGPEETSNCDRVGNVPGGDGFTLFAHLG
jgi:hypothetical protein